MTITLSGNGLLKYRLLGGMTWSFVEQNQTATITVEPSQQIEFSNVSPTTWVKIGGDVSDISIPLSSLSNYTLSFSDLRNLNSINISSQNNASDVSKMLSKTKILGETNLDVNIVDSTVGSPYHITDVSNSDNIPRLPDGDTLSRFNIVETGSKNKIGIADNIIDILPNEDGDIDLRGTASVETLDGKNVGFIDKHNIPVFRDNKIIPMKYPYIDRTIDNQFTFEMDMVQPSVSNSMDRDSSSITFDGQNKAYDPAGYSFEMDMVQPSVSNSMDRDSSSITFDGQNKAYDPAGYSFEMDMVQPSVSNSMDRDSSGIEFDGQDSLLDLANYSFEMDIKQYIGSSSTLRDFPEIIFDNQDKTHDLANYTFEMDIIDAYEIQE